MSSAKDHGPSRRVPSPPMLVMPTNEQRYYDALKRISSYMTPGQIARDAKHGGLSVSEYMEMAYDNMREEAKRAIKGKKRP